MYVITSFCLQFPSKVIYQETQTVTETNKQEEAWDKQTPVLVCGMWMFVGINVGQGVAMVIIFATQINVRQWVTGYQFLRIRNTNIYN